MKLNEKELLQLSNQMLSLVEKLLKCNIYDIDEIGNWLPSAIQLNSTDGKFISYMNQKGCSYFDKSLSDLQNMGNNYIDSYIHPYTLKLNTYLKKGLDKNKVVTYLDPVRPQISDGFKLFLKSKKLYSLDTSYFISISYPANSLEKTAHSFYPLVREHHFFNKNFSKFGLLSPREIEIIKLLIIGYGNIQIADNLGLSRQTVEQHRKNINRKLETKSYFQLLKFAQAFDLI